MLMGRGGWEVRRGIYHTKHMLHFVQTAGPDPEGYKISTDNLRKAHAAVNILGWGILLPTGAIIARYCRQWDPAWFYLHITFQILGFIFILAGLITGSKMYGRLKGLPKLSSHRALGIFLFTLACLQVIYFLWMNSCNCNFLALISVTVFLRLKISQVGILGY
jgi:hypothetical protein